MISYWLIATVDHVIYETKNGNRFVLLQLKPQPRLSILLTEPVARDVTQVTKLASMLGIFNNINYYIITFYDILID